MNSDELKARTKAFALAIISMATKLPKTDVGRVISYQIIKSSTSVGANYRAACRGKSKADFIYKINMVEEEADETLYWLELINEAKLIK
jgi:four helix bundle protein